MEELSISQAKGQGFDADVLTLWRADGKSALIFVQSLASAKLVVSGGLLGRAQNITIRAWLIQIRSGKEREKLCWNL